MHKVISHKVFIWNMVGSMTGAIFSFLTMIVVVRLTDSQVGGIYSIANAIAQMMLTIGWFGIRSYQVTDVERKYSDTDYVMSRVITCFLMFLISCLYVWIGYGVGKKATVIILMCAFRVVDAFTDVIYGSLQIKGRLDIAGQLLTVWNLFTSSCYFFALWVTRDILISTAILLISGCVVLLFVQIPILLRYCIIEFAFIGNKISGILAECFPLFLCTFMNIYLVNSAKYSIDFYMANEYQTLFNIIFMPTNIINLFVSFAVKPMITGIAEMLSKGEEKRIAKILGMSIVSILFVFGGISIFFCRYELKILTILYGIDVTNYVIEFCIILVGGCLLASTNLFYNVLVALRMQKIIIVEYIIVAAITLFLCNLLVKRQGILGGSIAFAICQFLLFVISLTLIIYQIAKENRDASTINNCSSL